MWLRFEGFSGYKDCRIQNLKAVPGDRSRYFQVSFREKRTFQNIQCSTTEYTCFVSPGVCLIGEATRIIRPEP